MRTRFLSAVASLVLAAAGAAVGRPVSDTVVVDLSKPLNTFVPNDAMGAALDGMEKGEVKLYLTPFNIRKMQSSGLRRLTYRSRPELGIEVWHWTEEGTWSDPVHQQGYWVGSDHPTREPDLTWGYSLPRRGDTIDNATNAGYSRIDDGDPATFWKSNPYLDRRFTGLAASRPQWIVLSFKKSVRIDAARIQWGEPFARHFQVQYWDGVSTDEGRWRTFAHGDVTVEGEPTDGVLRLADTPIATRFLRVLMLTSSETAPEGSTDIRDRLGYAVREAGFGTVDAGGRFRDVVEHGKTKDTQTVIRVSSTDPWHRASDRDLGVEQPSLDFVFRSGLGGGAPLMVPVGVFYDTPENGEAEIRYIRRRGWPVTQVELGEEPDGHFIRPEDYADLYALWAKRLHAIDPALSLGGPSMQGALTGAWPDPEEGESWTGRFVTELTKRGGLDDLQFFSFEHYAFDGVCRPMTDMLLDETALLDKIMDETAAAGMPKSIPWIISEYALSPFAGRQMSDMGGALYAADVVGHFMSRGGSAAYMFGYTPDEPINQKYPCAGFGNMMMFQADDDDGHAKWAMPLYWAERMMVEDWAAPNDKPHRLFAALSSGKDRAGRPYVAAYPLLSPDGRWAVMLVNRDARARDVSLVFRSTSGRQAMGKGGTLEEVQYSPAQYRWLERGEESHPTRDKPPVRRRIAGGRAVRLPAMSLTVVAGDGPTP